MIIEFTVYATPEPQGSLRAFIPKGCARPVLTSDNPNLKSFRQEVAKAAIAAVAGRSLLPLAPRGTAVLFYAQFFFLKPPSLPKRVTEKTTRPDLSKLLRATEDALTGIIWQDDSQVTEAHVWKAFTVGPERARVIVATGNTQVSLTEGPLQDKTLHHQQFTL